MKKTVLALALLSILGVAQASENFGPTSVPAVDDATPIGYNNYMFDGKGLWDYHKSIGSFTGMTEMPASKVTIDMARIAKKNGDSDKYVYWLVTNNRYQDLIAAFKVVDAIKPYSLEVIETIDDELMSEIALKARSEYINQVVKKCDVALDANEDYKKYHILTGGYYCKNIENKSTFRQPSLTPVSDLLLTSMMFDRRKLLNWGSHQEKASQDDIKYYETRMSLAYLALYNAAQVSAIQDTSRFFYSSVKRNLGGVASSQIDFAIIEGENSASRSRGGVGRDINKLPGQEPLTFDEVSAYLKATSGEDVLLWTENNKWINEHGEGLEQKMVDVLDSAQQVVVKCFSGEPVAGKSFCSQFNEKGRSKPKLIY